jgi:hypothetical protein
VTDLESEENKTRFYEKNQYRLHWTLSSTQAESLHDECTMTPAMSLDVEPLDAVNPAQTNHNLYATIIVVTAFVAMESDMAIVISILSAFEPN